MDGVFKVWITSPLNGRKVVLSAQECRNADVELLKTMAIDSWGMMESTITRNTFYMGDRKVFFQFTASRML